MREILFRGKRVDNGEWVEGFFVLAEDVCKPDNAITPLIFETDLIHFGYGEFNSAIEVIPETVGQYTGVTDRNGRKIFEGDVVDVYDAFGKLDKERLTVEWDELFSCWRIGKSSLYGSVHVASHKIIGNIHDNPKLPKGGKEK
jgi:uncharacterized phage protein (TIGR01671 family)